MLILEISLNQIIDYFGQVPIAFVDIFTDTLEPGTRDQGRTTAPGLCGLVIPISGGASFSFNGTSYEMKTGMVVHAGPKMPLEIDVKGTKAWTYAVIHYQILKGMENSFPLNEQHFLIDTGDNAKIIDLLNQLIACYATPSSMAMLKAKTIFMNILEAILLSAKMNVQNCSNEIMEHALQYINTNYAQPISIEKIAREFGIERRRFAYLFEQHTGMNPSKYLTEFRIRRAKKLMWSSNCSIAQVAESVGYMDCFYFSRVFKKHTGMSPSAFRKGINDETQYI